MSGHLLFWCAGKGRGRKRKGSGSEEDYSPMKKMTKPVGRVSIRPCLFGAVLVSFGDIKFLSRYCQHMERGLTGILCTFSGKLLQLVYILSGLVSQQSYTELKAFNSLNKKNLRK